MVKDVSPDTEASRPSLPQPSFQSVQDINQIENEKTLVDLQREVKALRRKCIVDSLHIYAFAFTCGYADVISLALHGVYVSLLTGNWIILGVALATYSIDVTDSELPERVKQLFSSIHSSLPAWWIYLVLILCGLLGGLAFSALEKMNCRRIALISMPIIILSHVFAGAYDAYGKLSDDYSALLLCPVAFAYGLQNAITMFGPLKSATSLMTANTLKVAAALVELVIHLIIIFRKKVERKVASTDKVSDECESDEEPDKDICIAQKHLRRWKKVATHAKPFTAIVG